ncbi:MAG: hypothetical protein J6N70_03695 [Oribacterium sp.]|nr:hypothetical protein [Oribacterium sp.]MBQ5330716.1 hypothetical protein [Oscillospiraceae bacterium]
MIKDILSPLSCAGCRLCCSFDKYEIWQTPTISRELKERIQRSFPHIGFTENGSSGSYLFDMRDTWDEERELFLCPALDPRKGCILGDDKPFECRIWPYKAMDLNGTLVISIDPICREMYEKPLSVLVGELEKITEGDKTLEEYIYGEAEKTPALVKPCEKGFPILKVR